MNEQDKAAFEIEAVELEFLLVKDNSGEYITSSSSKAFLIWEAALKYARSGETVSWQFKDVATVIGKFLDPSKNLMTCIDKELPLGTKLFTNSQLVDQAKNLTFEQIEDCLPEEGCYSRNEDGALVVNAQFLHDFARNIIKLKD